MNKNLKYTNNKELLCRFVNDYKIPINSYDNFEEKLKLLEKDFNALTLYNILENIITDHFNSNPDYFKQYYLNVRENVIESVINSDAFKEFSNMDLYNYMEKRSIPTVSSKIYNKSNVDKTFVSIDLKQANFQALKYINKEIVFNTETYQDFIGKFTDNIYIKNSKYFRQVIFGQMNPSRHITIERYIIFKIYDYVKENFLGLNKLVTLTTDEIVFELSKEDFKLKLHDDLIKQQIKDNLGFDTHVKTFTLSGYQLEFLNPNTDEWKILNTFYIKNLEWNKEYKCIPEQYFIIIYKLLNNIKLSEMDYHFRYEQMDCIFNSQFRISEIH